MRFFKNNLPLFIIIIIGSVLRLWQLGSVPMGVTHDEMGYLYNAYAISQTQKNVFSEFLPLFTWLVKGGFPFLPVPIYFSVPFFWIFGLSATTGRLPAAMLGILDIILIYSIVCFVFHKKTLALLAAVFLAISPWHLHFSRTAYDSNYALFFYLLAIALFLYALHKRQIPILSCVAMLLAVFSYRGMSIIFFPLSLLLLLYGISAQKINRKQITGFLIGTGSIILCFAVVLQIYGKSYTQEAFNNDSGKMQSAIDDQTREAQGPLFVKRLFLNKPLYVINVFRENYVRAYSPEFLFLYTEPNKIYSIWSRGRLYFFDLILILFGISYLFSLQYEGALFILGLLLLGGIPGGIGGLPYSARNFFLSSIFPILSAGGILFFVNLSFLKKYKIHITLLFFFIYTFLLGSYLFDYYMRYAYYSGESWAKSLKDVSIFVAKNTNHYDKVIISNTTFGDVLQYAFWAKIPITAVQHAWSTHPTHKEAYRIGNVYFQKSCETSIPQTRGTLLYIQHSNTCHIILTPFTIIRDYPGNSIWEMYQLKNE